MPASQQPIEQHTIGHHDCPACRETRQSIMYSGRFADYLFPDAAEQWLGSRRGRVSPKTLRDCQDYAGTLAAFFGAMRLCEIHIGHLVTYQRARQAQIRTSPQHAAAREKLGAVKPQASDGSSRINHELCMLRSMLRFAGLWTEQLANFYEPLPTPRQGPGIALTEEEERHLFKVASSRTKWLVAYYCAMLTRNTSAGPGEVLHLQLGDVDLNARTITVRYTEEYGKNEFRERTLPLNSDALAAVAWLLDRARRAGAARPEHYLVPARGLRRGDLWDPSRPMGSYRKAWEAVRAEAGKKFPRLLTVRRYDMRHTAITKMLENPGLSYSTIEKMAGHRIGSRTKQKYDHVRDATMRGAADILNTGYGAPGPVERGVQTSARAAGNKNYSRGNEPPAPPRPCRVVVIPFRSREGSGGSFDPA